MSSIMFKSNFYMVLYSIGLFSLQISECYSQQRREKAEYNYRLFESMIEYNLAPSYSERALKRYPKADFEKFLWENFKIDSSKINRVYPGDLIPEELLDLPLWVVNDEYGRDTTTLRQELGEEWTILDVWAAHCGPCIKSMNKWESIVKDNASIKLIGVYTSPHTYEVAYETKKLRYQSPQIIGRSTSIFRAMFLGSYRALGPVVWIRNGRLFGISNGELTDDEYSRILSGEITQIPAHAAFEQRSF